MAFLLRLLKCCATVASADDPHCEEVEVQARAEQLCESSPSDALQMVTCAAKGLPCTLLTLPLGVLEAICARLSLRDRISFTSCCRAILARPDVLSSQALWGDLLVANWTAPRDWEDQLLLLLRDSSPKPPPPAAWLARRCGGLRVLRLKLSNEAEAEEVVRTLAHASRLTHLELTFQRGNPGGEHEGIACIPPCLAALPPAALVALDASGCYRLGEGGARALAALAQCTALTRLNLCGCGLNCLSANLSSLTSLPALAELDIGDNGVPCDFELAHLMADLYDDFLCCSQAWLARLTALTRLNIVGAPIAGLPQQLAALPALRSLALLERQLGQGWAGHWAPLGTRLRSLRLSRPERMLGSELRPEETWSARLSLLVGLEDLDLDGCFDLWTPEGLRTALEPLRHLTALTGLSLCEGRHGLPPQLSVLKRLAHLNISRMHFGCVKGASAYKPLRHLTALTHLDAFNTGLRVLPPQLTDCTRLARLSLGWNHRLTDVPGSLGVLERLHGLTYLDLRDCSLLQLPPQLSACSGLLHLALETNRDLGTSGCQAAFEPLRHLAALTYLSLQDCGLGELPPQLAACTALRELWAGSNRSLALANGDGIFGPLRHLASLTRLSLRDCDLRQLPPQLTACTALVEVDIFSTRERKYPPGVISAEIFEGAWVASPT